MGSRLKGTPNPGGGTYQKKDDEESPAAKYAREYSEKMNPKPVEKKASF